jgi:hypothetical protein
MKRKALLLIVFIINTIIYTNGQAYKPDPIMKEVNPFFMKMIYESIVKIEQMNKKYESENMTKHPPVYIAFINYISVEKKECNYAVSNYQKKQYFDSLDATGYLICGKYTVLIYSKNYKDVLTNIVKIPPISKNINEVIESKYTEDFAGETSTYSIRYKHHKYKIKNLFY